jgi:hypothetical protein
MRSQNKTIAPNMTTTVMCGLFVIIAILIAQAGLWIFNRWKGHYRLLQSSNEVAGILFGCISLIYSLILAFVIVAVWQDYENLDNTIQSETDKLNGIVAHTGTLPPELKKEFCKGIYTYCGEVAQQEWTMRNPDTANRPSAIPSLRHLLLVTPPQDKMQEKLFDVIDQDLSSVSELRRQRLAHAQSQIPSLVWLVLQAGSITLIIFFYFFNVSSMPLKRVYLSFLTGCIAMCMYLVYMLDHPFNSESGLSNKPFIYLQTEVMQYYYPVDFKTI